MAGLLCEEEVLEVDNVKYCGYCKYHFSKMVSPACLPAPPHLPPLPQAVQAGRCSPPHVCQCRDLRYGELEG